MAKIVIKNVGPIKSVNFQLNKINVLMGPQSSGKSTIAKIISYCQWAEKRFILDGSYEHDVAEQLLEFHRLSENYFSSKSFFSYESDFVKITYEGENLEQSVIKKDTAKEYKNTKNIYIPSERNFVSVIPNLSKYKETNDNIMSFVYDWYSAKRTYKNNNSLPVLGLGIDYYNSTDNEKDMLRLANGKEILLREGSSGLQSLIPLIALIEYLTEYIYNNDISNSVDEKDSIQRFLIENFKSLIERSGTKARIGLNNVSEYLEKARFSENDIKKVLELYLRSRHLSKYNSTKFIIEEPEQNLFPSTQRDLINYLLGKMLSGREHSLILTTHSPYILYAINNCLMGYNVREEIPESELQDFKSVGAWTNPKDVSIWQVKNGELLTVKDERTNTVTKHYFNEITKEIMDEYYSMLNYFEYEK